MLEKIRNHFRRIPVRMALTPFGRTGIPLKAKNPFMAELQIPIQASVLVLVIWQFAFHLTRPTDDFIEQSNFDGLFMMSVATLVFILTINLFMAFWHIRRHHDQGLSGWHVLKPYSVSFLIAMAYPTYIYLFGSEGPIQGSEFHPLLFLFGGIAMFAHIGIAGFGLRKIYFLKYHKWIETTQGDPEANRFGPPPPTA